MPSQDLEMYIQVIPHKVKKILTTEFIILHLTQGLSIGIKYPSVLKTKVTNDIALQGDEILPRTWLPQKLSM